MALIIYLHQKNLHYIVKMFNMGYFSFCYYLYKPYVAIQYKYDLLRFGSGFSPTDLVFPGVYDPSFWYPYDQDKKMGVLAVVTD